MIGFDPFLPLFIDSMTFNHADRDTCSIDGLGVFYLGYTFLGFYTTFALGRVLANQH